MRGEGTHVKKTLRFVRGEGTHVKKALRFVKDEGTHIEKAPRFVRDERIHGEKQSDYVSLYLRSARVGAMRARHTLCKKTSRGESLAKSHAYNRIRDSWQDAWRARKVSLPR